MHSSNSADRWIYLPAAVAVAAVVVLGFAPSYFLRPFLAHTDSLSILVQVHGALLTVWVTLFFLQAALVASGRTDLHRRLGMLGTVLVPLIFAVGMPTAFVAAKLGGNHMPGPPFPALALILASFLEFAALAGLALCYRFQSDIHKRLMLLALFTTMEAAALRLPIEALDHSFVRTHVAVDSVLLLIVAFDTLKRHRLHPAFLWGYLFLVSMQTFSLWISGTSAWLKVARGLIEALG